MWIILVIISSIINELDISLLIKAILTPILGVGIAFSIIKMSDAKIQKLYKFTNVITFICKTIAILFVVIIIIINIVMYKDTNKHYNNVVDNTGIHNVFKYSDVISKNIIINTYKIYDGVQFIYYSIINEEDKVNYIDEKYTDTDNEIIALTEIIVYTHDFNVLNTIDLVLGSRKTVKSIGKLIRLQYFTIISFSLFLYVIIRKIIYFNKKRKTD